MTQQDLPATLQDALAEGFTRLEPEAPGGGVFKMAAPHALCMTSPVGARCHQVVHDNGDRTVGFCNGAGQCILYVHRAARDDRR